MKEELEKLQEAREDKEKLQVSYQRIFGEFEGDNKVLIALIQKTKEEILGLEEEIREEALYEYKNTGEKKQLGGVGIKIMKKLSYDPKQAFGWAKEHSLALQLDKRAFEKIAKAQELDIVEELLYPIATIPKDIKLEEVK